MPANLKDSVAKNYLSEPSRFAQLYNNTIFGGSKIIQPEHLTDLGTSEMKITGELHQKMKAIWKERDILKLYQNQLFLVLTLVVYWGTKPWDGAKNLHELLDIPQELAQYKDKIINYQLNLLEIHSIKDLEAYTGE